MKQSGEENRRLRKPTLILARMDLYEKEEEELLSLQARMRNGGVVPAAKVERVGKSSGKGGQQDAVAASHDRDFREAQRGVSSEMHTMRESDLLPILGNVIERDVSRGRGSEDGLWNTTGNLKKNDNEMNSEERGRNKLLHFPVPEHRVKSKFTLGRSREVNRSDIGDKSLQPEMPVGDADSILHNMTPDEVEKARDEILSRFKGSTIDFLKKRGAKKRNVERDLQRQSEGADGVKEKLSDKAMETASSLREPFLNSMLFSENLLSRLRFGRDGSLDSLLSPQKQTWESVLKRDPIRHEVQALGRHGQYYYSFDELYVLCRSTEFRQRVMGMSFLGDLLSTCRKHLVRNSLLDISPELISVIQKEGLGNELPLKWVAIWHHATYSLQIAKLIRFSMDDSNIQVVVESLKSMTQYLGASPDEIKLMEACDAHPVIGSPRLAFSHIQRQGCGTEWLSAPLDLQSTAKTIETGQHCIPLAEEELDEQDLARVDPLSGLFNMNLVGRVMHLMQRKDFQSETSRKLGLQCLLVLAQDGTRVCEKLASASIVVETLYESLTVRTHGNLVDILTLNILKLLFQSSKRFCAESSTQPIRRKIKAIILSNTLDSPRNGTALDCFKVCIQIWRAWLINQTSILYFDDAFSSMCLVMFPSWDRSTDWKRAWPCAREGLLLAAISCTKNNISAQCCQALVKQVMDWMQEMPYPISFIMDQNADSEDGHLKYELASVLSAAFFLFSCSWKFAESWEDSDKSHLKGHFSKLTFLGESSLSQFWRHWSSGNCGPKYQYSAEQNLKTLSYGSLACCMTEFMLTCKGTKSGDMACIFDEIIASIGKSIVDSTAMGTQIEQIIQPWQAYSLQHILNLGRIFTIISSFALEHKALSNVTAIADASIWLLVNLPPGSEDLALRLLSLLFSTEYCHQPFCNALKAVEGSLTRFGILSGIKNIPEILDAECLRLDALSGVSRNILGYDLESDTSEKQSSLLNYDGIESMILHPEGEFLFFLLFLIPWGGTHDVLFPCSFQNLDSPSRTRGCFPSQRYPSTSNREPLPLKEQFFSGLLEMNSKIGSVQSAATKNYSISLILFSMRCTQMIKMK